MYLNLKFSSSVLLAIFQVLRSSMWPAPALLAQSISIMVEAHKNIPRHLASVHSLVDPKGRAGTMTSVSHRLFVPSVWFSLPWNQSGMSYSWRSRFPILREIRPWLAVPWRSKDELSSMAYKENGWYALPCVIPAPPHPLHAVATQTVLTYNSST